VLVNVPLADQPICREIRSVNHQEVHGENRLYDGVVIELAMGGK
jgi:hypothetical protein